jgi:GntR family transcriptional regulator/MocR family aminotransferase
VTVARRRGQYSHATPAGTGDDTSPAAILAAGAELTHHEPSHPQDERMRPAIPLQLDRTAKTSLVEQIRQGIGAAIQSGVLVPGARLPSWQALAAQLGVARGTVREAYDRLADAQMIVSLGSAGTHVAARPTKRRQDAAPVANESDLLAMLRSSDGSCGTFQVGVPAPDAFPAKLIARLRGRAVRVEASSAPLYPETGGETMLRRQIAAHVAIARGIDCSAGQIVITSGFAGALGLVMHVLRACGQTAWVEDPGFPHARQAMRIAGVTIVPVPVDGEGIDVERGMCLAPSAALAIVTPGQQAPLGPTLSLSRRLQLIEWASRGGTWIIEDDYLGELQLNGRAAPALASLDPEGRVIHIGSFSKTISPTLRLGFIIVPLPLVRSFAEAAHYLLPAPGPALQLAIAEFMRGGHYLRHLRRMKRLYAARRDALIASLTGRGFQCRPAGLSVLVDLPGHADDTAIVRAALASGIAPAPLSVWYASPERARPGLLLGVSTACDDRVEAACNLLRKVVDAVAARSSR